MTKPLLIRVKRLPGAGKSAVGQAVFRRLPSAYFAFDMLPAVNPFGPSESVYQLGLQNAACRVSNFSAAGIDRVVMCAGCSHQKAAEDILSRVSQRPTTI